MQLKQIVLSLFFLGFSFSCAHDYKNDKIKTSSKWLSETPDIAVSSQKDKKVYLSIRNTSGTDLDIRESIKTKVESISGYKVVTDLDDANYVLKATIRYYGAASERNYGLTVGSSIVGGVAGGVLGHTVSGGGSAETVGGAAGGAALFGLIANYFEGEKRTITMDLVVDIYIGERVDGTVTKKVNQNSGNKLNQSAVYKSKEIKEAGASNRGSTSTSSYTKTEDFAYHSARLLCSAVRINLTEEEAEPVLNKRLSNAISQVLP
jgi:hypothetical protein